MMTTSRVSATLSHLPVFQDFERGQAAGCSHDPAARMGCRSAHVQVLNRSAERGISRHGAQEEQLFKRKLSLEDVALAQSPLALQVERSDNLTVQDDVLDVRSVLGNRVDDGVAKLVALGVPVEA